MMRSALAAYPLAEVEELEAYLFLDSEPRVAQFHSEGTAVDGLQKTIAQGIITSVKSGDDVSRELG